METLEMERKEARPAIISFQMSVDFPSHERQTNHIGNETAQGVKESECSLERNFERSAEF
jgi:hypothetical protein